MQPVKPDPPDWDTPLDQTTLSLDPGPGGDWSLGELLLICIGGPIVVMSFAAVVVAVF
jgi:hypothetical protein